jgi:uncharacterized Ntn-hydrolase superfamily protein
MKKTYSFLIFLLVLKASFVPAQHTFSICAIDTLTGEVGTAGASCVDASSGSPTGAAIISSIHPGIGAIHTQAAYLPQNQAYGDALMNRGKLPKEIIDSLVAHDANQDASQRQYGVVRINNGHSSSAAYSGMSCPNYYNTLTGPNYSIQGNTLLGAGVLDSMKARFLRTQGDLACKLMAAMQGAKVVGADVRCTSSGNSSLSSFLRVACPNDVSPNYKLNLVVPQGPYGYEPIDSLQKLFTKAHLSCSVPLTCSVSTGSAEAMAPTLSILAQPNPFFDFTRFYITGNGNAHAEFVLYSVTGARILSKDVTGLPQFNLERGVLGSGIYFYCLHTASGSALPGKLIIQ